MTKKLNLKNKVYLIDENVDLWRKFKIIIINGIYFAGRLNIKTNCLNKISYIRGYP